MDCLFCAIIKGDIPSTKVYEDDKCYAFLDINPQAPVHCLIIPKVHLSSLNDVDEENAPVIAHIMSVIPRIAVALGLERGYRVVTNVGEDGCQSVKHLHFHILGGEKLSENMA
jgi:histidine triad (HIT) family protein